MLFMLSKQGMAIEDVLFCLENTGIYGMPVACCLSSVKADFLGCSGNGNKTLKGHKQR